MLVCRSRTFMATRALWDIWFAFLNSYRLRDKSEIMLLFASVTLSIIVHVFQSVKDTRSNGPGKNKSWLNRCEDRSRKAAPGWDPLFSGECSETRLATTHDPLSHQEHFPHSTGKCSRKNFPARREFRS